ncbi:hypothetical protein [Nocardioides terrigena]|uniref:hypothetical protein n=1 Tax=Nocardioides terrigena TaxID=424797 RepID=UPI000D31B193|nr:hypothetical protein [Nocardioides terrigena]
MHPTTMRLVNRPVLAKSSVARSLIAAFGLLLAISGLVAPPPAVAADYAIAWTQIGIYPRSAPSMDAPRVGQAMLDDTHVTVDCELTGTPVSNGYQTTDIWERLSDGTFLPNAFLDTGVDGWTPGIPHCDELTTPAESTPAESPTASSGSWVPYCGASEYLSEITVTVWADEAFMISAAPTENARRSSDPGGVTAAQWHAIQACVSGLYGDLADSIWDQLECHQHLALVPAVHDFAFGWATGETYDLESWRGTFSAGDWISARCGNELNMEHNHFDETPVFVGRPDTGVGDLFYGNIA